MKELSMGKFSLRNRIFVSMLIITLISTFSMALVTLYRYNIQTKNYHQERLLRKENAINEHLSFILNTTDLELTTDNLASILNSRIYELSNIHDIQINIYDLEGRLLLSSKNDFSISSTNDLIISPIILRIIESSPQKRFVDLRRFDGETYRNAYNYITDSKFKNLGIVSIPYKEDTSIYDQQMKDFFVKFIQVFIAILILSIVLAYFLSKTIIGSIQKISDRILKTTINNQNQKIVSEEAPNEIQILISAYNKMVDELEISADKLARSERENAWKEMAKQVAHEIKNPLTPMRLTVQMFDRKFDPENANIKEKVKDFTESLIQQIDTMTAVASAFSNFATMPNQEMEKVNLVKVISSTVEIFNEDYIHFTSDKNQIIGNFDKTQIVRIVNNLIKNAIQAIPNIKLFPEILVDLKLIDQIAVLTVSDNGLGIKEENLQKIFEPKFTTKSSGMGLGLAMVKNIIESYGGTISVSSKEGEGTTFKIELPIK